MPTIDNELPTRFPFPPHYNPILEAALKARDMESDHWAKFITAVCDVLFEYKTFPRAADYESVAKQCVERYPFLSNPLTVWVS